MSEPDRSFNRLVVVFWFFGTCLIVWLVLNWIDQLSK